MKIPKLKTDKNKIVSKGPSSIFKYHFVKNKTQTTSKPNGPKAEMIPILKTPSQIYFDQQENIYPSSDEVLLEIQSQSNIDTKPQFQFPLKEYTQEILNITKYNSEKKIPTFSTALNLNTPSILTPETFYTNKTIYENPSTSSQPSSTANNSYFMLQSIKSTTQNAMNFTLNDPKISPLTFLEKVEKLKGKKKLNASVTTAR